MKFTTRTRPGVVDAGTYKEEVKKLIAQKGDIVRYNRQRYRVLEAGMKILRLQNVDNPADRPTVYRTDCHKEIDGQPPTGQTL